jgi:cobalt-precorrin-5B (C1)-methyltransferase
MRDGKRPMTRNRLREGFTTGTAATAAAKAAMLRLFGLGTVKEVDVPLPREGRLHIPVETVVSNGEEAEAVVIKDGGDDPDATHRAHIHARVRVRDKGQETRVCIQGGAGVGRVTRPGLPVPVGEAAINPAPRKQIETGVLEALKAVGAQGEVQVIIEVENGERMARKTLNPRLGIVGGISILGTRGTVKPFSNQAYRDTISVSMDVAASEGLSTIALSTGGKSERLLQDLIPDLPQAGWIQAGDFFSFSLQEAAKRHFREVLYSCFFGKLVKMAQGHPYTHARKSRIDFQQLARWARIVGVDPLHIEGIAGANTSREVLEILQADPALEAFRENVLRKAGISARKFLGPGPCLRMFLFDFDGRLLGKMKDAASCAGGDP